MINLNEPLTMPLLTALPIPSLNEGCWSVLRKVSAYQDFYDLISRGSFTMSLSGIRCTKKKKNLSLSHFLLELHILFSLSRF